MPNSTDSCTLTVRQKERLERLWKRYNRYPLFPDAIHDAEDNMNLSLATEISGVALRHPFVVAAWAVSPTVEAIEKAHQGVWAAVILPTAAAEDASGGCLLAGKRAAPRPFTSRYDKKDTHREYPRVERPASLYPSDIAGYAALAATVVGVGIPVFASLAFGNNAELKHSASVLKASGVQGIELVRQSDSEPPGDIGIPVFLRPILPDLYTGEQAFRLLAKGNPVLPVFSLLVGKVRNPPKISFNRYEQVLYRLLFHPEDGFLAAMTDYSNRESVNSVQQILQMAATSGEASP